MMRRFMPGWSYGVAVIAVALGVLLSALIGGLR